MNQQMWTLEKLQQLIDDKIEEGLQLEYKAANALGRDDKSKREITKDVSAFANSNGGIIVYGIKEYREEFKRHLPEMLDFVDGREFSREWLDQIIGQISPRIPDVNIYPVRGNANPWEVIYVVVVLKSNTAHQAQDFRYYRRYNFESVAMDDYEIRDVMNRKGHPKLDFKVRLLFTDHLSLKIMVRIWNVGYMSVRHHLVRVLLPKMVDGRNCGNRDWLSEQRGSFSFWRLSMRGTIDLPLFPGVDSIKSEETPLVPGQAIPQETPPDYLICTLYADEMPPMERKILISQALHDWT